MMRVAAAAQCAVILSTVSGFTPLQQRHVVDVSPRLMSVMDMKTGSGFVPVKEEPFEFEDADVEANDNVPMDLQVGDRALVVSKARTDWNGKIVRVKAFKSKKIEAFLEGTNPKYSVRKFSPKSLLRADLSPELDIPRMIEEQFRWVEDRMKPKDRVLSVSYDPQTNQNVVSSRALVGDNENDDVVLLDLDEDESVSSLNSSLEKSAFEEKTEAASDVPLDPQTSAFDTKVDLVDDDDVDDAAVLVDPQASTNDITSDSTGSVFNDDSTTLLDPLVATDSESFATEPVFDDEDDVADVLNDPKVSTDSKASDSSRPVFDDEEDDSTVPLVDEPPVDDKKASRKKAKARSIADKPGLDDSNDHSIVLVPAVMNDSMVKTSLAALSRNPVLHPCLESSYLEWNKNALSSLGYVVPSSQDQLFAAVLTYCGFTQLRSHTNQDQAFAMRSSIRGMPMVATGVLHGHGTSGHTIAELCRREILQRLPVTLRAADIASLDADSANEEESEDLISRALSNLLEAIDTDLPSSVAADGGSTSSFVVHYLDNVYFVNTGDSTSFLMAAVVDDTTGLAQRVHVVFQTNPDKPVGLERERLEGAGMRVDDNNLVSCHRIVSIRRTAQGQEVPVYRRYSLAVSRALGERDNPAVIATPTVTYYDVDEVINAIVMGYNDANANGSISANPYGAVSEKNVQLFAVSVTNGVLDKISIKSVASRLVRDMCDDKLHALSSMKSLLEDAEDGWFRSHESSYRKDMAIAVARII